MSSVSDLMFQHAPKTSVDVSAPDTPALARLAELGARQVALERRIARGEEFLASLGKELMQLRTKTIPDAMSEAKVKGFDMLDGSRVEVKKIYSGSIPTEAKILKAKTEAERRELTLRRERAFAFLRESGSGALIKNEFSVPVDVENDELAGKIAAALAGLGADFERSESVNASTLTAFVKEQMERGRLTDEGREALGAFALDVSKIVPKKEKKG